MSVWLILGPPLSIDGSFPGLDDRWLLKSLVFAQSSAAVPMEIVPWIHVTCPARLSGRMRWVRPLQVPVGG